MKFIHFALGFALVIMVSDYQQASGTAMA